MTCTHVIALSHTHLTTLNMLCAPPVQLAQTLETTDVFTASWDSYSICPFPGLHQHSCCLHVFTQPDKLVSF